MGGIRSEAEKVEKAEETKTPHQVADGGTDSRETAEEGKSKTDNEDVDQKDT